MSKDQSKKTQTLTVTPDYTKSVTGLLLLAALLSSLIIMAGRSSSWDNNTVTGFILLLSASVLIAVTCALVLRVFNSTLKSLQLRASLISAYTILMVTTFIIVYFLYPVVQNYWTFSIPDSWVNVSLLQVAIIATVNFSVVLMIISLKAKNLAIRKSSQAAKLQALQSRIRPHFMFNS